MSSLDSFKSHIRHKELNLDDEQIEMIFVSTILTPQWDEIFKSIYGNDLPNSTKKRVNNFVNSSTISSEEREQLIRCHMDKLKVKDSSFSDFQEKVCCNRSNLAKFIQNLQKMCPKSTLKLKSNDVVGLFIDLTLSGPESMKLNAPKELRYEDKRDLYNYYKTKQTSMDVASVMSILSLK